MSADLTPIDGFRAPSVDRDIVEHVLENLRPSSKGQQAAMERTLQDLRDRGQTVLGVVPLNEGDELDPRPCNGREASVCASLGCSDQACCTPGWTPGPPQPDLVNHPPHYTAHPSGVECITVVEHMGFNLGNAVKYIWRADEKGNALEDLEKARWYIDRELQRRAAQ